MSKELQFYDEAKDSLLKGIEIVYQAVSATLGPRGNNVAIERQYGAPIVLQDGVSVAREIELKDKFQNMGAQLIKQAAEKTNEVGDGTTLSTILTYAIVKEYLKNISAGHNAMIMRRGINKAVDVLTKEFKNQAKEVKGKEEAIQVATISAQNEDIGKIIAEAIYAVGAYGVVTVEESGVDLAIDYREGMEFDKGYTHPNFITDPESMEAIVKNPNILILDKSLNSANEFIPLVEKIVNETKNNNLVVIAEDISGESLAFLVINKLQGKLNSLAVKSPGFGDDKKEVLKDIAILTGGKVVGDEINNLEKVDLDYLGMAGRVTSSKDNTLIVDGKGNKKEIDSRTDYLKGQIEKPELSDFDREKYRERMAKLNSGIAVINVGANTEAEMKEKKERVIDAISATKAAIDEGIVPGGETIFIRSLHALDAIEGTEEELVGVNIIRKAVQFPFKRLMENSGFDAGEKMAQLKASKDGEGIDVIDGQVKDMIKSGVIDPAKVVRSALENAASSATMIGTTSVLIANHVDKTD